MKLLNEQELKLLIKNNEITCLENTLYFNDSLVTKDIFVRSLKEIIDSTKGNKNKMESIQCEDVGEYRKQTQKSKNKRRKSK